MSQYLREQGGGVFFSLKKTTLTSSEAGLQLRALRASVLVKGREMGLGLKAQLWFTDPVMSLRTLLASTAKGAGVRLPKM